MRVAVFSTKPYDRTSLTNSNQHQHDLTFFEPRLTPQTASLATCHRAVCVFVNDEITASTLERLADEGIELIALRCSGFNNVDLKTAARLGITVARVPSYSPYAVAEHTLGLILALNRNLHRAYNRVRDGNFALDGLIGFDVNQRTVGVIGTGKIGQIFARLMRGFNCEILGYDPVSNPEFLAHGGKYTTREAIYQQADIISLHCPLTDESHHLIDDQSIAQMRDGVMLINTSRGALIDTQAVIRGLKSGRIGYLGLDVYEEESDLFFEDLSNLILQDDTFTRLLTFHNVLITGHQAFFTKEALRNIADTTLGNITEFEQQGRCQNSVGHTG